VTTFRPPRKAASVGRARSRTAHGRQALSYGDLVLPQLPQQIAHQGHAHALHLLSVIVYHQVRPVPREDYGDLLSDL
jgi:hypothetical protein